MKQQFIDDVRHGLNQSPKSLPSKYFYDKKGDELFMQIMAMPEYYLTRAETEIFTEQTDSLINLLTSNSNGFFELIELGAGDGSKTKALLTRLLQRGFEFNYIPVDISNNVLQHLKQTLNTELPILNIKPQHSDYFQSLKQLQQNQNRKILLYLGSNLGNMNDEHASQFLTVLSTNLQQGDTLLLGLDRLKSKQIVLPAYNDAQGITATFNLNLLTRINNELGGNFDLDYFKHSAQYSETTGIASSALQCIRTHQVYINHLKQRFHFQCGEKIHTEISRKYNDEILNTILEPSDFSITAKLNDSNNYFSDYVLTNG